MKFPTELFHYSACEIKELRNDFHDKHREHIPIFSKPHGFWFSVEDYEEDENWKTWCEGERFRLECLKYRYSVGLRRNSDILLLGSPNKIIEFGRKYAGTDPTDFGGFLKDTTRPDYIYWIKWEQVMEDYDGIIIAPYQWSCRLASETTWYYGWDCSSGCIWNMDIIEIALDSIREEIPELQEAETQTDSRKESEAR